MLESQKSSFSTFLILKGLKKIKKIKIFETFSVCKLLTFEVISTKVNHFWFIIENFVLSLLISCWVGAITEPIFEQQYLENSKSKQWLHRGFSSDM